MLTQLRAEGLRRARHLGRGIADEALGGLQAPLAQPIAITTARLSAVLVIAAVQNIAHLRLQTLFDDQPGRQLNPLRAAQRLRTPACPQPPPGLTGAMHSCKSLPHRGSSLAGP